MGDHYIPQYYLKGFTGNDDLIWVYEKGNQRKFVTRVKNIAHENDFYSREIEQYLANEVEAPANQVLSKIRSREPLLSSDKLALSTYMVALLKRVPDSKRRLKQRAPEITQKMRADIDSKIINIITAEPAKTEYLERKRSAIHGILDKYAKDPPKKVWLNTIPPDTASKPLELMQQMTWLFLVYESARVFITSDNPVFFFAGLGIGNAESEITFPISSNIILWANWRSDLQDGYYKATMQVVKEMNRRTASKTTRYIYHAEDERWIPDFMNKENHKLHMLL
jgi:hypothetical protein